MQARYSTFAFAFFALGGCLSYASGDFSCGAPKGNILHRAYETCNSVPFLSPSNDSRLNLELLLIDAGKLTGALDMTPGYPMPRDVAFLRVPFDLGDWQVGAPGAKPRAGAPGAEEATNSGEYAQGEGSRCANAKAGIEAFTNAVASAGLPPAEASVLKTARIALVAACDSKDDWKTPDAIHSSVGREFATYAAGASKFYSGDFKAAVNDFKSLNSSANPWLRETSRYMIGRAWINSAQAGAFGEYGDLQTKNVAKDELKKAEDAFNAYLHDFPNGLYAASARGLLRRVYWLGGDQARLADAYDRAFAEPEKGNVTAEELVQEVDNKLLTAAERKHIKSPQLLAILDLMFMRSGSSDGPVEAKDLPPLALAELEAQKDLFAGNAALYNYLLAAFHIYVDNKPEQALALLPSTSQAPLSYFAFSQQTLRALAMDATKQYDEERKQLMQMLPLSKVPLQSEQVQLEIASLDQHTMHVDRVFAAASPVQDKAIRTIVVEFSASPEMLRQRIKDPKENTDVIDAAAYTLLYKELTGRRYKEFQADLALMPSHPSEFLAPFVASGEGKNGGYHCPPMRQVAATLEHNGNDAQSLNCVGELVRNQGVHYGQDAAPSETELGGGPSAFPATNYSRMDGYLAVIANHQADSDARAYALYRAVRCYAPSGYNDCGKQDIPATTRKEWFQTLHREYADSVWAKSLKFYW